LKDKAAERIRKAQEAVEAQNLEAANTCWSTTTSTTRGTWRRCGQRRQLLEGIDQRQHVMEEYIDRHCAHDKHPGTLDLGTLRNDILTQFGHKIDLKQLANLNRQEMADMICDELQRRYQEKEDLVGPDVMR
jgi:preprotein translocase subunit SecA